MPMVRWENSYGSSQPPEWCYWCLFGWVNNEHRFMLYCEKVEDIPIGIPVILDDIKKNTKTIVSTDIDGRTLAQRIIDQE
jgi:hypothetical protein